MARVFGNPVGLLQLNRQGVEKRLKEQVDEEAKIDALDNQEKMLNAKRLQSALVEVPKINMANQKLQQEKFSNNFAAEFLNKSGSAKFLGRPLQPMEVPGFKTGADIMKTLKGGGAAKSPMDMAIIERKHGLSVDPLTGAIVKGFSNSDINKANSQFIKLNDTIGNMSSRRVLGRYQLNIDTIDGVEVLIKQSIDENRIKLAKKKGVDPSMVTDEETLDEMPPFLVSEVVTGLARVVSQAAPTKDGIKHLEADTIGRLYAVAKQWTTNRKVGARQGDFLLSYRATLDRERQNNVEKRTNSLGQARIAFSHLDKFDKERLDAMFNSAMRTPGSITDFNSYLESIRGNPYFNYINDKENSGVFVGEKLKIVQPSPSDGLSRQDRMDEFFGGE